MFNQAEGVKLPKFVVQLSSAAVLYGFYIEKSDEVMDSGVALARLARSYCRT
jgi:hypothetical protein